MAATKSCVGPNWKLAREADAAGEQPARQDPGPTHTDDMSPGGPATFGPSGLSLLTPANAFAVPVAFPDSPLHALGRAPVGAVTSAHVEVGFVIVNGLLRLLIERHIAASTGNDIGEMAVHRRQVANGDVGVGQFA